MQNRQLKKKKKQQAIISKTSKHLSIYIFSRKDIKKNCNQRAKSMFEMGGKKITDQLYLRGQINLSWKQKDA